MQTVSSRALPEHLLDALVDPLTHEPVHPATPEQLAALHDAVSRGAVRRRGGGAPPEALDGALMTSGGRAAYPIVNGLPHLLVDDRLELHEPLGES